MGARLYRETFTVTRKADGTFEAKLHGYPFYYIGATAQAAMTEAGRVMDATMAIRDDFTVPHPQEASHDE